MATKAPDKIPPGPKLDALTAEKVFGWKNVHKHYGALVGKRQDKAGALAVSKGPELLDGHCSRIRDRRTHEATWAVGSIPERTIQGHSRQRYSF